MQYKDLFYICIILGICIVVIFSFVFYDNQDAINLFSFASTLASIILSIVAIFISISGERAQELHRSQIAETAKKLENTRVKLENNIENLNDKLDQIEAKIEKAVKNTDKLINYKYIKSEDLATENESYEESLFEDEKS